MRRVRITVAAQEMMVDYEQCGLVYSAFSHFENVTSDVVGPKRACDGGRDGEPESESGKTNTPSAEFELCAAGASLWCQPAGGLGP